MLLLSKPAQRCCWSTNVWAVLVAPQTCWEASASAAKHYDCTTQFFSADQEQGLTEAAGPSEKPGKAKKQKQKGAYAPQRLLSAVCKVAPHFKVNITTLCVAHRHETNASITSSICCSSWNACSHCTLLSQKQQDLACINTTLMTSELHKACVVLASAILGCVWVSFPSDQNACAPPASVAH